MNVKEYMKDRVLLLDGGMGTLLQAAGLTPGEHPEAWNITHPDTVQAIHRAYYDAGSHVVSTNTFGANPLSFPDRDDLVAVITAAVANVRAAREASVGSQEKFIALDIGPTGRLLRPYGDFDFEDAVAAFAETVRIGVSCGVDLILIETMNDSYETKAALLAAKENVPDGMPIFVTNAYGKDGKLMTGATPSAMVALLEGMGADAVGANCSLGPRQLMGVVDELLAVASVPVILKPNAGLPAMRDGQTVFDVRPDEFATDVADAIRRGVRVAGGCCGTTPEHIDALAKAVADIPPVPLTDKGITCVSSYTHAVTFGRDPILIGERINPTGKKRLKQALREHDMDYILREAIGQEDMGAHVLDVNVGLPEIDEPSMLRDAVCELQAVCALPLQIDTSDPVAMEAALCRYNGKAMINSVNGKAESMAAVFPLAKKYGGLVVALTLDEDGIPATAEGRVAIAKHILEVAETYGISKKDIIFDTLAMTVSADSRAAVETLRALQIIRHEMGCHTSLGVSNVSFGLPNRDAVNGTFFAMALDRGLSAAIMNPHAPAMRRAYFAYRALSGLDADCADFIRYATTCTEEAATASPSPTATAVPSSAAPATGATDGQAASSDLQNAIVRGLRDNAAALTDALLSSLPPMEIVQSHVIPALDVVGKGFEQGTVYLPQLLMSAEAAACAFERVKVAMLAAKDANSTSDKMPVVIATVKGDIHDIGKNIVKLLLENYGFRVIDLGRDVPPETVLASVLESGAPLAALSALMTTTVPAMAETVTLLHQKAPRCRVLVGGAVLNKEYAASMGADAYAPDAMASVRYAEQVWEEYRRTESTGSTGSTGNTMGENS